MLQLYFFMNRNMCLWQLLHAVCMFNDHTSTLVLFNFELLVIRRDNVKFEYCMTKKQSLATHVPAQ